jgi:hypothetical protein
MFGGPTPEGGPGPPGPGVPKGLEDMTAGPGRSPGISGTGVALLGGMATKGIRAVIAGVGLALVSTGCASQGPYLSTGQTQLGGSPHQIGPVTVVIRPQAEVEMICRLRSPQSAPAGRVHGCYVPADRMIISTADPYVLMHEFKHYFEGAWHK